MKKNICFITNDYYNFDVFYKKHILNLANDHKIFLLGRNILKLRIKSKKIFKYEIPITRNINLFKDIFVLFRIFFFLKKNKITMVQTLMPKAGLLGMIASFFAHTPLRFHIFTGQVWYTKKNFLKYALVICDKLISSTASKILCDGKSQRKFLISKNIVKKNKIINIGDGSICGVDKKIFYPNIKSRKNIRLTLNIKKNHFVFLYLGRLNKDKGILDVFIFFTKLFKINKKISLLLVGRDEMNINYHLDKLPLLIKKKVKYLGFKKNSNDYYNACDCNILLSKREGFGNTIIESAFVKKFSLVSDTYGLKDFVNNTRGLIIKDLSSKNILKTNNLINNKKKIKFLSNNAYKDALPKYNSETVSKNYYKFYKWQLSKI